MACPYFIPECPASDLVWPHPKRLPLGNGYRGTCGAPGHAGALPADRELQEMCNLGYAGGCPRLPAERSADAVRFGIVLEGDTRLVIAWVLERAHLPAGNGTLEYDRTQSRFIASHPDPIVQRQAECFVESCLAQPPVLEPSFYA